jgi:hypothetical protein
VSSLFESFRRLNLPNFSWSLVPLIDENRCAEFNSLFFVGDKEATSHY